MDIVAILQTGITALFLVAVLSYYVLLVLPIKKRKQEKIFRSITIIIPAHNEQKLIEQTIQAIIDARFDGKKSIIVVDDGSKDNTCAKVKKFKGRLTLIQTNHLGKSSAINTALKKVKTDLVAVVDADSCIEKDSLWNMAKIVGEQEVGAATGVILVQNKKGFPGAWLHIEQSYNSLMRSLFCKINANVVTPGPLSMYRTDALRKVGGFSTKGFSEDVDVTIRLVRAGYKIGFSEKSVSETAMPTDPKGFFRQRIRFARGMLGIFKRHTKTAGSAIDIYTLPLLIFTYLQAVIIGSITVYQIVSGYFLYFASKGIYLSFDVLQFFFQWLSIAGFIRWTADVLLGNTALTLFAAVGIVSTLLSYPLFLYALIRYDKKISVWSILALMFMFPFWLIIMAVYLFALPELLRAQPENKWKKNE